MGSIWFRDLPDVLADAGVPFRLWPGWETRSRSSGGYDQMWGIVVHHTASNTAPDNDCGYMWDNADDRPVGAILIDRSGRVTVGAAGATNCAGKGGPWTTTHGTIPLDKGNAYTFSVEAANDGVGEPWPRAQTDTYLEVVVAVAARFGLNVDVDVAAHFEWTDRKQDPVGPSPWAAGAQSWDMDDFRDDLRHRGDDDVTDQDIDRIAAAVWQTMINTTDGSANIASVIGWTYAAVIADDAAALAAAAAPQALEET